VGYALVVAFLLGWVFQAKMRSVTRGRKMIFIFCCFLAVELYGFATVLRNFAWTSEWTLWEDAVNKSPHKARPHIALGLALVNAGRLDPGIQEFKKALQIEPKNGGAYLNLGYTYFNQGKNKEAIEHYQKALSFAPRLSSEIHNDLGLAYLKEGRTEEGLKEFQKAIEIRPHNAYAYFNLGNYFEKKGDINQAISFFEKAVKLEPEIIPIHKTLSRLYSKKGCQEKSLQADKNYLKYSSRSMFH
jgi:tetratricopeptide (TPR) repeat protein